MRLRALPSALQNAALALGLLALATASSGCGPKDPIMRVNGSTLKGGQFVVGTFPFPRASVDALMEVYVTADNPNGFDLQVRGVRGYIFMMNGRHQLRLDMPLGVWLPADRTTAFSVPINIPVATGIQILRESVTMTCVPFTVQGVADVTATSTFRLNKDNYPFNQNGCIPRQQLLMAFPGG
jgi:hypothetical protein